MISDTLEANNNANNIKTLHVSNLFDSKSFLESFLRKSKTISISQRNGYFGYGGPLLKIHDMRADILG